MSHKEPKISRVVISSRTSPHGLFSQRRKKLKILIMLCALLIIVYSVSVLFNYTKSSILTFFGPITIIREGPVFKLANKHIPHLNTLASQQSLLDCLTSGEWIKQPFSKKQEGEMVTYLREARSEKNLPYPLQRRDKKCGNITFGEGLGWYRALCDPSFDTPCCFHGRCLNKTVVECQCEDCYDMRSRLYAEYSTWKNRDGNCRVNTFQPEEACATLNGTTVDFIGDSHMRHVVMGFQILLTGDQEFGWMLSNMPPDLKTQCHGLHMFTNKDCAARVVSDFLTCSGKVRIRNREWFSAGFSQQILKTVEGLIGKPNSLLVIGLGHHDSYNSTKIISLVGQPVLKLLEQSGQIWPKVIWMGAHSVGLLKTPTVPSQQNPNILALNAALRPFLASHKVLFFNSFNLSKGVASPDGSHYTLAVNDLKARVLLDFIHRIGNFSSIVDHIKSNITS